MIFSAQDNKVVVRTLLQAMERGDVAALDSLLDESFVWTNPQHPDHSPLSGERDKTHFLKLFENFAEQTAGGYRMEIKGLTAEGDRVAVEAESFAETPAGLYNNRYHFLFVLHEGRLVAGKEYADSAYMKAFTEKMRVIGGTSFN